MLKGGCGFIFSAVEIFEQRLLSGMNYFDSSHHRSKPAAIYKLFVFPSAHRCSAHRAPTFSAAESTSPFIAPPPAILLFPFLRIVALSQGIFPLRVAERVVSRVMTRLKPPPLPSKSLLGTSCAALSLSSLYTGFRFHTAAAAAASLFSHSAERERESFAHAVVDLSVREDIKVSIPGIDSLALLKCY